MKLKLLSGMMAVAMLSLAPLTASAQIPDSARDAVRKAVESNPEVQGSWHAFRAAENEQDAARSGYLPRVDLEAGVGRERLRRPNSSTDSFSISGATLSLTQMLYDGFFTRSEVSRFGHARMVRYFELLEGVENVALESMRAYLDVLRYRDLVSYAQENYVEHRVVYDQILERTRSGVGRGVDTDLATGRLALAEANLLTEVSNLHDVTARYLRIVGERPGEELEPLGQDAFAATLPPGVTEALEQAYARNPGLKAAVANIHAGQGLVESRRSAFHPRVDLRLRESRDRNLDGLRGTTREGVAEVVLNFNLYRGGGDKARLRQAAEDLNAAHDTRERVCRDLRQAVSISYNDNRVIEEQLTYLEQHQASSARAREAYRQQFDIGQRTLLDLLDGENEYFDARRAYANAYYNRLIAQAGTLARTGTLLETLGVARESLPSVSELAGEETYSAGESVCPPVAPEELHVDKEALFAEAKRAMGDRRR